MNRRLLLDIVDGHRRAGATVVIITHQMEEVERLCDRILLLKDGAAAAYGTVPEVQDQFGGRVVRLGFSGVLPESPLYRVTTREQNYAELELGDGVDDQQVLRDLVASGIDVRSFDATRISMEEVFLKLYGATPASEEEAA